jgi:hemoglobin
MSNPLYERLGGSGGIHRMVDDVIAAHLANPVIRPRFESIEDMEHAKQMAREFFGAGSGGPESYTGRDMRSAHRGMNISEQEFLAVVDDIMDVAEKHGLDEATKKDVLAILYSLKGEIVRV